jgi:predicted enzyme related to lactoylglutathione lyase
MKVIEFAFVGYPVTDLPRARAFYEGVLGFTPASIWGDETKGWYEYEVGPHTLAITNMSPDEWKPSNQGAALALEVDDFEAAVQQMKDNNVTIAMGPFDSPVCRMLLIRDPDGNTICIHKRHAQE